LIKGKWYYLYRAVDKHGETIDFLLTEILDKKAAKRFLTKMITRNGKPSVINIDKSVANKAAMLDYNAEHNTRIKIRHWKYINNIVEADHRFVKRKIRHAMTIVA
jgi:transposase-like protein